jgi:protein involved in polysaccharide export with SLBB domain
VDVQGNIFIPKVGTVTVAGVTNQKLVDVIRAKVRQKYNNMVFVYANVAGYQPVWVFVTGNVNLPGLYQGMASDSVLQFIDKAKGINLKYGSFRQVEIVRNNKIVGSIDLYRFLANGALNLFQFHDGDAIVVGNLRYRYTVTGEAKRPFMFEFSTPTVKLKQILKLAMPDPSSTNVIITRWQKNNLKSVYAYSLDQIDNVVVQSGDVIDVYADHTDLRNTITITGEHQGLHTLVLKKDVTLANLLAKVKLSPLSEVKSVQLFRKSVAEKQKQLLLANLKELETLVLTTSSISKDEAFLRSQEAKSVLAFIDRAKKVEPKGQIVIHDPMNLNEIYLADEDQVFIPRKSSLILVQGEVSFPGAHTYIEKKTVLDYIVLAGDFGSRANKKAVLVIRQNGSVIKFDSVSEMKKAKAEKGDSILVLPKLEGKNVAIIRDITQIIFQIAMSAGVVLAAF